MVVLPSFIALKGKLYLHVGSGSPLDAPQLTEDNKPVLSK